MTEVTCRHCKTKGIKEEMTCVTVGEKKKVNKYFHPDCYNEMLIEKSRVACVYCKKKELPSHLQVVTVKEQTKYAHEFCHEQAEKERLLKEKETEEKNSLNDTILEIFSPHFDMPVLPKDMFLGIADIRNGIQRNDRRTIHRKKEGYTYKEIEEAFLLAQKDIDYALKNKSFNDVNKASRYVLAIVNKYLPIARKQAHKKETKSFQQRVIASKWEEVTEDDIIIE